MPSAFVVSGGLGHQQVAAAAAAAVSVTSFCCCVALSILLLLCDRQVSHILIIEQGVLFFVECACGCGWVCVSMSCFFFLGF